MKKTYTIFKYGYRKLPDDKGTSHKSMYTIHTSDEMFNL